MAKRQLYSSSLSKIYSTLKYNCPMRIKISKYGISAPASAIKTLCSVDLLSIGNYYQNVDASKPISYCFCYSFNNSLTISLIFLEHILNLFTIYYTIHDIHSYFYQIRHGWSVRKHAFLLITSHRNGISKWSYSVL